MTRSEAVLFLGAGLCGTVRSGLFYLMAFKVNRQLPPDRRIPYSGWGYWGRLRTEYNSFYPRSILFQLMQQFGIATIIIAVAMVALCSWEYVSGK